MIARYKRLIVSECNQLHDTPNSRPMLTQLTHRGVALRGEIERLMINPDRALSLETRHLERVEVTYGGFKGDQHAGELRPSCGRVKYFERGTEIRNSRQLSVLSTDELSEVAGALGLTALDPTWLGANLTLAHIPALSALPPGSRLVFEGGVSLVIDLENGPCVHPEAVIRARSPEPLTDSFVSAALGRRGVMAWVERAGELSLGERCDVYVPSRYLVVYERARDELEDRREQKGKEERGEREERGADDL